MVDSNGAVVGIIETVGVDVTRLRDVTVEHARDEGEGHTTVAQWRAAHERFWHSDAVRCELGDPTFTVDDDTPVVLERFRL
ncbi:MAG: ASCH domain-containing protein, partial [Rhodococcus sp. (in: high G+C Gram-positive bacteria)]